MFDNKLQMYGLQEPADLSMGVGMLRLPKE